MTKNCPKCGKELPDNAKFCMDCGYSIKDDAGTGFNFSLPTLFIILIIAVLVVGGAFIITSMGSGNSHDDANDVEHVDLTITEVSGWDSSSSGKKTYSLHTDAIFNKVPSDVKGYNVKTTYYDSNDTEIGHETETLDNVYYESSYALTFGFYSTYKIPDPDHVTVEIIKDGKVVDTFTEKVDQSKIDYLN